MYVLLDDNVSELYRLRWWRPAGCYPGVQCLPSGAINFQRPPGCIILASTSSRRSVSHAFTLQSCFIYFYYQLLVILLVIRRYRWQQCWNCPKRTGGARGGVRCRNVWNFAQGLKFKADFHWKIGVCIHVHELGSGGWTPTPPRQFQPWLAS